MPNASMTTNRSTEVKILVTGANGQLGRSLQKTSPNYPQYEYLFTDMPEVDITDKAYVSRLVKEQGIDLIVNCAAYTAVDRAESEPELAERINAFGPAVLAQIAVENHIGLIHVSTDYVFPGTGNRPLKEDDVPDPRSVYGRTKWEGEKALEASGCDATILRTAWLYSEFGNNFVKTMLRLGKQRPEVSVVCDQIGSPTYAEDLARAILLLAGKPSKGFRRYHYTDRGEVSWYDFARAIFELYGLKTPVKSIRTEEYPSVAPRPAYSVLSNEKIQEEGIPVPLWKDSLRRCLETIKQQEK